MSTFFCAPALPGFYSAYDSRIAPLNLQLPRSVYAHIFSLALIPFILSWIHPLRAFQVFVGSFIAPCLTKKYGVRQSFIGAVSLSVMVRIHDNP